ncbi:MAG: type II toxin-antitoxin system ParD family antitoxin [Alphaproteobacteria bacterium]|jgi:putative addiction module CopG family antidote|nr:type II toxin-antitoxin system ParD family antitoxin [Thalassospira sp.]MCE2965048.1 type II toxin-antitoxin system ParD family antitoxin [Alphaproteobacteria bacterium]
MHVTIQPAQENFIAGQLRQGLFDSAESVVSAALKEFEKKQKLDELKALIQEGFESGERDGWIPFNAALMDELHAEAVVQVSTGTRRYNPMVTGETL